MGAGGDGFGAALALLQGLAFLGEAGLLAFLGGEAGEFVDAYQDEHFGLPVFSLYGQALKLPVQPLADIDATMRAFDTQHTGKTVEHAMLRGIDVLVFDLQDVGTDELDHLGEELVDCRLAARVGGI